MTNVSKSKIIALKADDVLRGVQPLQFQGDCVSPVERYLRGLPDKLLVGLGIEGPTPNVGWLMARCRLCQPCLAYRARKWSGRAGDEVRASTRTWFGTLTYNPHYRTIIQAATHSRLYRSEVDYEQLDPHEQFAELVASTGDYVTRFLKRVRKQSASPLRYIFVSEAHKDGMPHHHCLIHEQDADKPVRKALLEGQWPYGFTQWRLATGPCIAYYVAKYISKDARTRIRASLKYGQAPKLAFPDPVQACQPTPRLSKTVSRKSIF